MGCMSGCLRKLPSQTIRFSAEEGLIHVLKNDPASCLDHRCSDRVRRHHPRFYPNAVPDRLLGGHRRSACNPCRSLYLLSPLSPLRRTAPNVGSKILSRVWKRSGYGPPGLPLTRIDRNQSKSIVPEQNAGTMLCCFSNRQTFLLFPNPANGALPQFHPVTGALPLSPDGMRIARGFQARFQSPGFTGLAQQRPNAGNAPALTAPEPRIRRSPRARGRPFRARRTADAPADPRHSGAGTAGDRSAPSRAPCPPRRGYPHP